jgi:hypothetical protein
MSNAQVRAIRPHDTSEGLKQPGEVYDRTREDADTLAAIGVVEIVEAKPAAKVKRTAKAK